MALKRIQAAERMNQAVVHANTVYLADMADFAAMNEVWDAWVSPGNTPCRACVEAKLAAPRFSVEIMVIAALD